MGFIRLMLVVALAGCVTKGEGQAVAAQKGWYSADPKSVVPDWTHGVEGKPFTGKAVWTTEGRDPTYGDGYTRSESIDVMRDGRGRERLAWRVVDADARVSTDGELRTVLLLDPVARCMFLWMEDGAGKSLDEVKVRCEPEGVEVPPRRAWNELTAYEKEQLTKEPESKPRYENVAGETKNVGGVQATRYKHEEVREFDAGKRVQRSVEEEEWYADALGMVVQMDGGDPRPFFRQNSTSFQMKEVKLGEPSATGFALPAGAVVVIDPKLRLVWESGARGQGNTLHLSRASSDGEWPSVNMMAMTDQARRMASPVYPEAWFAGGPEVAMPTFYAGPKGKPFDVSGQFNIYSPNDTSTVADQTIFFYFSQDSEGRNRIKFRFLNGGDVEPVYVEDAVTGCIFQWNTVEPWMAERNVKVDKKAKVRCQAHGVVVPPLPRWDDPNDDEKAQIAKAGADKLHFVREKVDEEKAGGYRLWQGGSEGDEVDVIKYAEYAIYAATEGKPERRVMVGEQWFAPLIDRVVREAVMPPAAKGRPVKPGMKIAAPTPRFVMDMTFFAIGEPMEEFYPPRGYAVELDETILPPFAPVQKATEVKTKSKPQ